MIGMKIWPMRVLQLCASVMSLTIICSTGPLIAGPDEGKVSFDAKDCGSCHITQGPVDPVAPSERAAIKGPPLWFAGDKFQAGWLAGWLVEPVALRRVNFGTVEHRTEEHVSLSAEEAEEIAAYLTGLTDPALKHGIVAPVKLSRRKQFQGENLFAKKQICFGCHMFPSRQGDIGGFTGPSLLGASQRLNTDWIYAFFTDPVRYYPNGRMPVYGDRAFDPFTDQERELLIQYIGNM